MFEWLSVNAEWIFSGLGVVIVTGIFGFIFRRSAKEENPHQGVIINNHANVSTNNSQKLQPIIYDNSHSNSSMLKENFRGDDTMRAKRSLESYKNDTKILFIDDDARFKVAKILAKSGWVYTKLIKDASTLDDSDIINANILFIDVQGVGVEMGFTDEGLGLALAIKEKYPEKKVVIYSAETKGDRFHAALRRADSFLPKNADPYEFQKIVEDFTVGSS